jgi:hypothetical protein
MSPPPTIYTPPSELDGTLAGIIVTAVVASLALVMLIGMVYWADSHPDTRKPKALRSEEAQRPLQTAHPPSVTLSPEQPGSTPPPASAGDETYLAVGNGGHGAGLFGALRLIAYLTIGYMVARGIAKAGSRHNYDG